MGLEYSTCIELNQWEAQNHAANMKLWLHDNVDSTIVPSIVSFETLLKAIDSYFTITGITGISYKADQAYTLSMSLDDDLNDLEDEFEAHNHDALYAALSHNHDTDYASLTEAAKHLQFSYGSWAGQIASMSNPAQRTINLAGDTCQSIKFLLVLAYHTSTKTDAFLGFWYPSFGKDAAFLRWGNSSITLYHSMSDIFYINPVEMEGILDLYSPYLNYLGFTYRGFVWGAA